MNSVIRFIRCLVIVLGLMFQTCGYAETSQHNTDIVATATFQELGLTLAQHKTAYASGEVSYILRVIEANSPTDQNLIGNQFIGVNNGSIYTLSNLNEILKYLPMGANVDVEFYGDETFTKKITIASKYPDREVPKILISEPNEIYLNEHKAIRQKALQYGYIYKNENYWANFISVDMRDIFDGTSGYIQPESPLARVVLQGYVDLIDKKGCDQRLGSDYGVFEITETTRTFDGYGGLINISERKVGTVRVPKKFVTIYGLQHGIIDESFTISEALNRIFEIASDAQSPGGLKRMAAKFQARVEFVQNTRADMSTLFAFESCDSPVLVQFEENFYRYLTQQDTIQQKPIKLLDAKKFTDEVFIPGTAKSLMTSCMATFYDFSRRSDQRSFCRCQADFFENSLTEKHIALGKENYRLFESLIESGSIGRQDLYASMRRQCAK